MDEAQRARWRSGAISGVRGHMWINLIQWLAIDPDRTGDARFPGTRIGRKVRVRLPEMVIFVWACLASVWWYGGEHEQWMWFGFGLFSVTILVLAAAVERGRSARRYFVRTVALRQAAARGDDDLSPLVHPQPPPPALEDVPNVPPMTWAIFRPDAFWSDTQSISVVSAIVGGLALFSPNVIIHPGFLAWQSILPMLVAVGAVLLAIGRIFARRPFTVTADGTGLRWRRWGRRHLVPWHDVRIFAQLTLEPPEGASDASPPRMLYWAAGAHDRLVWMSSPPTRRRGAQATADQRDVAWRLCGIVAARSGRPLRDLSESTAQIVDPEPNSRLDQQGPGQSYLAGEPVSTGPATFGAGWRWKLALCGQLAMMAVLLLAGLGVLKYQPRVYAARLAQAESAPPLLSAPMTTPLVGWPVGRTLQGQFSFTSSGYELTSEQEYCCDVFGWGPTNYADATVEVTVHQVTDFDLSEAGLVVRADDGSPSFLVFAVTPKGDWRLEWLRQSSDGEYVPETLMWDGVIVPVGAVHRGNDATNRLAVIMRGGAYVFFINGQVVGTYQGAGPVATHVGVYSDGLSDSATFTNFAVYPDPPPSPFFPA